MRGIIKLLPLSVVLVASCQHRSGYVITGQLTGFPDSTMVYLQDINKDEVIDSALIIGGRFTISGQLTVVPKHFWLQASIGDRFVYTNLLIGNDKVEVTGDIAEFPNHVKITGSTTQDEASQLRDLTGVLDDRRDSVVNAIDALPPDSQKTRGRALWGMVNGIDDTIQRLQVGYIKTHDDTYAALTTLVYLKEDMPKDTVAALYERMPDELKHSQYGQAINVFIQNKVPEVGDHYVDFKAEDQHGDTIALSSLTGKYVLLDFSSAGCGPCIQSAKELRQVKREYSDSLRIVTFSTDVKRDWWQYAMKRDSVTWVSLWDGKGSFGETYLKYGINGVPTFILISPQGKVLNKIVGYGDGALKELLKKSSLVPQG